MIILRPTLPSDLEVFYENQADDEAIFMAAFTGSDPKDKEAYISKWTRLLNVDSVNMQTILLDKKVIGCVVKFEIDQEAEITYALAKENWRNGVMSEAVAKFLEIEKKRPIAGRVAFDNIGSQKILEKCGFIKTGNNVDYAHGRAKEIEEFIYSLT